MSDRFCRLPAACAILLASPALAQYACPATAAKPATKPRRRSNRAAPKPAPRQKRRLQQDIGRHPKRPGAIPICRASGTMPPARRCNGRRSGCERTCSTMKRPRISSNNSPTT